MPSRTGVAIDWSPLTVGCSLGFPPFYGAPARMTSNRPIMTTMNDNARDGYWLMASDGGVFSFHVPF